VYLVLLLLVLLVGGLVAIRLPRVAGTVWTAAAWSQRQGREVEWWIVGALALLSQWWLLLHLPLALRTDAVLGGDAASHAVVIQELARHGAPHGWIDAYDGGFPLGVNYPPLGWLLGAAIVWLGAPTATTVQALGLSPYLAGPVFVVLIARAAGARPLAALVGACALSWISPYNAWLGTFETHLGLGLLSQAMAVPFLFGIVWVTVAGRRTSLLPWLGAGLAASHAQITFMAALLALPAVALVTTATRRRLFFAMAGAAVAGVALYGPGLLVLRIPFAWTHLGDTWWIVGYKPDRILRWTVDFELFDQHRSAPIVTSCWLMAVAILALLARHRIPRIALALAVWSLALSILGRSLLHLGHLGEWIISFLQPQRAFALVPLAATCAIVVASEEMLARAPGLKDLPRIGGRAPHVVSAVLGAWLLVGAFVAPGIHRDRLALHEVMVRDWLSGRGRCGPLVGARAVVEGLPRGGRLSSIEEDGYTYECAKSVGVELRSPIPRGLSSGAGAQVGINAAAFALLLPGSPGSAGRAEAMGVRWLIHGEKHRPTDGGWREVWSSPPFVLSERLGGTDLVGVGCVTSVWRGSSRSLRSAIFASLRDGTLLDPRRLTAIEQTSGELVRDEVPLAGCDASSARVHEVPREAGAQEATIQSDAPVDAVLRVSALPTWSVEIDGAPAPVRVVAPGFLAVRVGPGHHRIVAHARWPPLYGIGLLLATAALIATGRRSRV
jgi:hypothetical protein